MRMLVATRLSLFAVTAVVAAVLGVACVQALGITDGQPLDASVARDAGADAGLHDARSPADARTSDVAVRRGGRRCGGEHGDSSAGAARGLRKNRSRLVPRMQTAHT